MTEAEKHPLELAVERATSDEDFRARLLTDAESTLEKEMGLVFPEGVKLNVVENTSAETTIVLPLRDEELDLESLDAVAGGAWCYHVNWLRSPEQLNLKTKLRD